MFLTFCQIFRISYDSSMEWQSLLSYNKKVPVFFEWKNLENAMPQIFQLIISQKEEHRLVIIFYCLGSGINKLNLYTVIKVFLKGLLILNRGACILYLNCFYVFFLYIFYAITGWTWVDRWRRPFQLSCRVAYYLLYNYYNCMHNQHKKDINQKDKLAQYIQKWNMIYIDFTFTNYAPKYKIDARSS